MQKRTSIKAALIGLILGLPLASHARIGGTQNADDALSVGDANHEINVDASGNIVTSDTSTPFAQNVGLSSAPFRNVETQNINLDSGRVTTFGAGNVAMPGAAGGNSTIGAGGSQAINGLSGTAASQLIVGGLFNLAKSTVGASQGGAGGIFASTTIPVNTSYETLLSSSPGGMAASTVTITATPSISTTTLFSGSVGIPDGTFLVLSGTTTSSVIVLQSSGVLAGSQLRLNGSSRAISRGSVLTLIFNAALSLWQEISFVP